MATHEERIEVGDEIIYAYGEDVDDQENLSQVLCCLMTWAFENQVDFKSALGDATRMHRRGK